MSAESNSFDEFEEDDESFGLPAQLRDPIGVLKRQRQWILVSGALLLVSTIVASAIFPRKYEASATSLLSAKSIPDEFVPTTIIAGILEQFEAIHAEVFSREGLSKIISETGLYSNEPQDRTLESLVSRLRSDLSVEPVSRGSLSRRRSATVSGRCRPASSRRTRRASCCTRSTASAWSARASASASCTVSGATSFCSSAAARTWTDMDAAVKSVP